jgi:hypothetical protein
VLLDLRDQRRGGRAVALGDVDPQRVQDLRQLVRKDGVEDDALDLDDLADVLAVLRAVLPVRHASPAGSVQRMGAERRGAPEASGVYRTPV